MAYGVAEAGGSVLAAVGGYEGYAVTDVAVHYDGVGGTKKVYAGPVRELSQTPGKGGVG